ncbi:MAG: 6-phospho-3-hexuloisomerase [Sediminibacterium sp.]
MKSQINLILNEIGQVLNGIDEVEVNAFLESILKANKIVAFGAGRVGMAVRGFAMRLGHLGFNAHTLGDSTVPSVASGDLLLIASGSGETQTIFDLALIGKKNGCKLLLVTGNPESRIGKIASEIVKIAAPSKTREVCGFTSKQPMTTLNEQCLMVFFDALVLLLMEKMNETHDTMWARHSNLE